MKKVFSFLKKETVFCVAVILAAVSAFFVPPSKEYLEYIDFRVLVLLFCLMAVVAAVEKSGILGKTVDVITRKISSVRGMAFVLVMVCFFGAMFITNDVALITFVPFGILLLKRTGQTKYMIQITVLQTIAANLGSLATPIGNPQNVFLYTKYDMGIVWFLKGMLPLALVAVIFLCVAMLIFPAAKNVKLVSEVKDITKERPWRYAIICLVFTACILCVVKILDYRILLIITIAGMVIYGPAVFKKVDYMLLITFVAFFIFVGNIKNITMVRTFIESIMKKNEFLTAVGLSQIISNVPAAVLLSGFTENGRALLYGTNIGGLGTIIASMASLISYRIYGAEEHSRKGKYMIWFTAANILFLAVMLLAGFILI